MRRKTIVAADLFAGAGGTSTALVQACGELGLKLRLTAVNHWPVAVETHAANHPDAEHLCETLDSADAPLPTVVGSATLGVVGPFLVRYNGTGGAESVADPLPALTSRDRFGLVAPSGAVVADILFRMLQPHELAAGMGFPAGYVFRGNRSEVVRQIGNAVEVNKARAHLAALLGAIVA